MTSYFVTRHAGAADWAKRQGIEAAILDHLDIDQVRPGDKIYGTLPVSMAAQVCARGARYYHLTLDLPKDVRGVALSADNMALYGARLDEFDVWKCQS